VAFGQIKVEIRGENTKKNKIKGGAKKSKGSFQDTWSFFLGCSHCLISFV
jgi:hypothetical protein